MSRRNSSAWNDIQEMNNATVQNSQHPDTVAKGCRKKLCHLVPLLLGGEQNKEVSKNLQKISECIYHCLDEFPQIYVIANRPFEQLESEHPSELESRRSMDFSKWLVQYICSLPGRINDSKGENLCVDLLIKIFEEVEKTNACFYLTLAKELVSLGSDLISARDKLTSKKIGDEKIEVCRFFYAEERAGGRDNFDDPTSKLKPTKIVLLKRDVCEKYQLFTMNVLNGMLENLTSLAYGEIESIWLIICDNLENGSYPLKQASLEAAKQLICLNGLPQNQQLVTYLVNCIVAVSLREAIQESHHSETRNVDRNVFQKVLADVIDDALIPCVEQRCADIVKLVPRFLKLLTCIQSEALQNSIGNVLLQITCDNAAGADRWRNPMINLIGRLQNPRWLSRCLFVIIAKEVEKLGFNPVDHSPIQLLPSSESSQESYAVDQSATWQLLKEKIQSYSESCRTDGNAIFYLQSTCEILQVGIHLVANDYRPRLSTVLAGAYHVWSSLYEDRILQQIIDLKKCYSLIIAYAKAMLNFQSVKQMGDDVCSLIFNLLMLPWMNETDLLSKLPLRVASNLKVLQTVKFDSLEKINALSILVALPTTEKELLASVLSTEMTSNNVGIQTAAIECLPVFLYVSGTSNVFHFEHSLRELMTNGSNEVIRVLANISGQLVCVLCDSCRMNWSVSIDAEMCYSYQLKCTLKTDLMLEARVLTLLDVLWQILFCHSNPDVRLAATSNLEHIFRHIQYYPKLLNLSLAMLEDENYDIRKLFSYSIQSYYAALKRTVGNYDEFLVHFYRVYSDAQSNNDSRLRETLILTVGNLSEIAEEELLLVMVVFLLDNLLSPITSVNGIARLKMQSLAKSKNLTTKDLLMKYRRRVSLNLVRALLTAQERGDMNPFDILTPLIIVFDFDSRKAFLQAILPDFLPNLVVLNTTESCALIRLLAEDLKLKRTNLLTENFRYIFSYLMCNCSRNEAESGFNYVMTKTGLEMNNLLRLDGQRIYNELLLQMGTKQRQVRRGLSRLAQAQTDDQIDSESSNDSMTDHLNEFIASRFLGFLVFFDSLILNSNALLSQKEESLNSLVAIIPMMGSKHITAVRMKLMTTLRLILQQGHAEQSNQADADSQIIFLEICGRAWDAFVRTLNVSAVGPMLSQIIVALLPLLRSYPSAVDGILKYLMVEKKDSLQEHFHELYFIPELPELEHIHAVIKEFQERPSSQDDLQSFIRHTMRGICHENREVRVHALRNLKNLLHDHQATLHTVVLGRDSVDPILPQLVASLLAGCRDRDREVRNLIGCCLGELGAVDPGRLETTNCLHGDQVKLYGGVEEVKFAIDLIGELTRSFLGARDTSTQDCSSYSIQEILLLYECHDSINYNTDRPGGQIWSGLSEDTRENIAPLLKSRYTPTASERMWDPQKRPIFYNLEKNTYHSWVTTWCVHLTWKVRQSKARDVFSACIKTIRYDDRVALFLLPHILVCVLQDGGEDDANHIYEEILAVLDPQDNATPIPPDVHHVCMQAVFTVLDYLARWSRLAATLASPSSSSPSTTNNSRSRVGSVETVRVTHATGKGAENVRHFLERIPKIVVANASFSAQAFTRSLMNLEAHVKQNHARLQENHSLFLKIYSDLDDADGIAGVISKRQKATLKDQILSHESTGQTQDALAGYELAISLQPDRLSLHRGLLQCLMDLDQPHTALTYASGLVAEKSHWLDSINQYRVESAWKLSSWDQLTEFLESSNQVEPSWGLSMGRLFDMVQSKNMDGFSANLDSLRIAQMAPLSAASMENGSYQRGYNYIVKLHMLDELEKGIQLFHNLQRNGPAQFEKMLTEWTNRKQVVQSSMRHLEPILNLRRVLLGIANNVLPSMTSRIQQEIGRCWLQSAQVSRKCGHLQRSYSSLLAASQFNLPEVFLEQAKWHKQKGEHDKSIHILNKVIKDHYSAGTMLTPAEAKAHAKARLQLARYIDESGRLESNAVVGMFREVVTIYPDWEDCHFYLAQYFDRLLTTISNDKYHEMMCRVIKHFGTSLKFGCRFVYQSMPRMLSLWLDYGSKVAEILASKRGNVQANTKELITRQLALIHDKIIPQFAKTLPPYLFLTAFSQLISRICHSHVDVFCALKEIIVNVLTAYPQQAVWMMMAVSKSTHEMRSKRCQEIFERAVALSPGLNKFISDATKLADKLVELCNKPVEKNETILRIGVHFKDLARLLQDPKFSRIILPRQISMLVTLPTSQGSLDNHDPFPQGQVYIAGIEDKIELMQSLIRPKKITLRGSDGKLYAMMCKPKDDLRKDCRLMEFNSVVNKFLLRDVESRRRQLRIRTYTVIPLNDECGLLEWVPNLNGLRPILQSFYREKKLGMNPREVQNSAAKRTSQLEHKLFVFKNVFLAKHPPVFSEWFLRTFPDPTTWYFARLSYCRTTAVMSMIGYILGLGDRHGENILLDSSCGDTVHVDFNCLFNKGETFEWPEVVPFRLTHNMVEAMGPLGVEGVYRRTCETTLRVMRKEIDTLMSLLKPFIYDPLVEWSDRPAKGPKVLIAESGELNNEKAKALILDIEQRLKGIIKSKVVRGQAQGLPLSIEGQVNHLIEEATNERNLCQMFIGWSPHF